MIAVSVNSKASIPYRAGLELGEGLADMSPEIVFLFTTIHYGKSSEILEGLTEALGSDSIPIVGNTGDGYYHQTECGNIGCVAMGLNSNGKVTWSFAMSDGVKKDPTGRLSTAWNEIKGGSTKESPKLMFLFSDFHTDANELENILRDEINVPVIGGLASDDNQMMDCAVFLDQQILHDSLVLVAAHGNFNFEIKVGNALTSVGKPGKIDHAEGSNIFQIDGMPAMDFIEQETGKPVLQSDSGVTSLTILNAKDASAKRLRAIVPDFSKSERSVGLYGGINTEVKGVY